MSLDGKNELWISEFADKQRRGVQQLERVRVIWPQVLIVPERDLTAVADGGRRSRENPAGLTGQKRHGWKGHPRQALSVANCPTLNGDERFPVVPELDKLVGLAQRVRPLIVDGQNDHNPGLGRLGD